MAGKEMFMSADSMATDHGTLITEICVGIFQYFVDSSVLGILPVPVHATEIGQAEEVLGDTEKEALAWRTFKISLCGVDDKTCIGQDR